MVFRWNQWNVEHIGRHGVSADEAEEVVSEPERPYPLYRGDEKWLVWGPTSAGRLLQVVYVLDNDDAVFVIHARPLTENEKRRYRRQTRR